MSELRDTGEPPHNPNKYAVLASVGDVDNDDVRTPIHKLMEQINGMDMSPELRAGHQIGIWAAQLTLDYIDRNLHPVHERAVEMGMLGALGCLITDRVPVTTEVLDHAETYQRVILFTRVLDDVKPEQHYEGRAYSSIASRSEQRIRMNFFGYSGGREAFSRMTGDIVEGYKKVIGDTMPAGEDITSYQDDEALQPVVDRFTQLRRSLYDYTPELVALDDELWKYARAHYARYLMRAAPAPTGDDAEDEALATARREAVTAAFFVLQ